MTSDSVNSEKSDKSLHSKHRKQLKKSLSHEDKNVIHIDQLVGGDDLELDYDLTDYTGEDSSQIENPDIYLDNGTGELQDDEITYSSSRSLISRPGSEATILRGRKQLDKTYDRVWEQKDFAEKRIIYPEMEQHEVLNAFKEVRTSILRNANEQNQVVMVSSLQYGMGATFNAVNLAAAFAYEGEKTALLVECDQRAKKLDQVFAQEVNFGLSDYLCDNEIGTEEIIFPTGIRRLKYIPIGGKQPYVGEFFSSTKMKEFITQVKRRYIDRYIILNAPPLEVSADAAILSEVCDQIVVVIPYGMVSNQRLKKALRLLPKSKITGVVVNKRS